MSRTLNLPDDQEEVWEHFDIEEYNWIVLVKSKRFCRIVRLEVHLRCKLQAVFRLIGALHGKVDNGILHIANIIVHPAFISVFQHFIDEIDIGARIAVDFFA